MEEIAYMVCMRVDELDDPVENSTTTACVECGTDIWISPASRVEMGKVRAMPVCSRCAARIAKEEENVETRFSGEQLSDAQFDEIVGALRAKGLGDMVDAALDPGTDHFETMKITSRLAGEAMTEPDDDWGSVVLMEDAHGKILPPLPLKDLLEAMPKQDVARRVLPSMAFACGATKVLFGISAWSLTTDDPDEIPVGSLTEHPDHTESLVLMEVTADGVQRLSRAAILRDGEQAPVLGEWHDSEEPTKSNGLFVDALVPVLQLIRSQLES